jgi:hypothetical protein
VQLLDARAGCAHHPSLLQKGAGGGAVATRRGEYQDPLALNIKAVFH